MGTMADHLPLTALLSHALVAFTIEFDNEAEHRLPHRTTRHGATPGGVFAPWLVSLAMWANCMRHLPPEGLTMAELQRRARTPSNFAGMQRWRYVTVAPDPSDPRPKPPRAAWVVRPTAGGRLAAQIWSTVPGEIENRWRQRFGEDVITRLGAALAAVDAQLDPGLPECMPILKYGLFCAPPDPRLPPPYATDSASRALFALLSRPLLALALEFENGFAPSLAICANLLRVLNDTGVRVRDLPDLSGVSKEALQMAMGIVTKARLVVLEKESAGSPFKVARLSPKGLQVQDAYQRRLRAIEEEWKKRFGATVIGAVRGVLEPLAGSSKAALSPLLQCLETYPENWRASQPKKSTLPHFPMVLHRGGFPDGS